MTQLLEVMEDFTKFLDNKDTIDVVYLDFKKAFDSVPHERLLIKLQAYGFSDNLLRWIRGFLSNRTQKVRVGAEMSSTASVKSGIPQGSILGPVLFTVFINDLPLAVNSICKVFADDTKVYNSPRNSHVLQNDLLALQQWSDKWQLHFNISKCKVMYIGKDNPAKPYTMALEGKAFTLQSCDEEKDLGVTFDRYLTFDAHIYKIINKANSILSIIKRTFDYLDKHMFLTLYKSLVRPHLEYGNIIWFPLLKRQSKLVENVQKRATKLLKETRGLPYEHRLRTLDLPTLKFRRLRGDLIQTFKIFTNIDKINLSDFFNLSPICTTRNSTNKIFIQHSRTNQRKNVFSNRAAPLWNSLAPSVKAAPNLNTFKNLLELDPKFSKLKYTCDE